VNATLAIVLAGFLLIALLGFVARRRPAPNLGEWTVAGRRFGAVTLWFLQAGEIFTTYTFLGIAGLTVAGGAAVLYSMPFVPFGFIGLYFLAPRVWRYARERELLTQADFFELRFGSPGLGCIVALLGVLFTLPYLQIQMTGLGFIVQFLTGSAASGTAGIVTAGVMIVAFMLWSGLKGIAYQAYFKDVLMLFVLVLLVAVVPAHFAGGVAPMFQRLAQIKPTAMTVHPGPFDATWFVTSLLVSGLSQFFVAHNSLYPAIYSARSERALRRNYIWLPLYFLCLALPMIIGYTAVVALRPPFRGDAAVLLLAARALPAWLLGVVGVAGIATALVPAAGLLLVTSSSVARNIVRTREPRVQYVVNQITVVAAATLAVWLAIARPSLLALLALLTYSGFVQLVPLAAAAILFKHPPVRAWTGGAALLCGAGVVVFLTFARINVANVNAGILGLGVNLAVLVVLEAAARWLGSRSPREVSA
jgi:SSS family solute:Na+ symporter